jgi:agmatine deiminase
LATVILTVKTHKFYNALDQYYIILQLAGDWQVSKNRFWQPPEWAEHRGCWMAFPYADDLWSADLVPVQGEFWALVAEIARSEAVQVLVPEGFGSVPNLPSGVTLHPCPYGDIWMRDIAPIFVHDRGSGAVAAQTFAWNGWGHKYLLAGDEQVSERVAGMAGVAQHRFPFVLEGGAIEVDGMGTGLTTRQCLLNPNRNPHLTQAEIEAGLAEALGITKVLWIEEGLQNDHTDGHIDTIVRFIAPHQVMCMLPDDENDANYQVLQDIYAQLQGMTDATGTPLQIIPVPSPQRVVDGAGELMPASYLNFYISNDSVIVPTYGVANDDRAVSAIAKHFPSRRVVGLSARHILLGGGAFHCITQQEPLPLPSPESPILNPDLNN